MPSDRIWYFSRNRFLFVVIIDSDTHRSELIIFLSNSWIHDVLEAYKARRKKLEENTEKSREEQFRTRESKLLVGDTESQKMIEAQLRFDELYKYDEARIRKEGYIKKSSGGKKDGKELQSEMKRSIIGVHFSLLN